MADLVVDQALYGYDQGHRLIAGSRAINDPATRVLRNITDTTFDSETSTYVTVLPLPDERCQVFIRTWPAGPSRRPGSVWSHVLFIDFEDVGKLDHLDALLGAFRRPQPGVEMNLEELRSSYKLPVELDTTLDSLRTHVLDTALAERLVAAAYSSNAGEVVVDDPVRAEPILFAIYEQQWPSLRRSSSFRTRRRSSQSTVAKFELEVVARSSKRTTNSRVSAPGWVWDVVRDLEAPNWDLRQQLRTFGAESDQGRRDLPALIELLSAASLPTERSTVITNLGRSFPDPTYMRGLKKALLGRASSNARVAGWPVDEGTRLLLLLKCSPRSLDYEELDVARRLEDAWADSSDSVVEGLKAFSPEDARPDQRRLIVDAVAEAANAQEAVQITTDNFRLGVQLLRRHPAWLAQPDLWTRDSNNADVLLDLLSDASSDVQRSVFVGLVDAELAEPASSVCALNPSVWWTAVEATHSRGVRQRELLSRARTLSIALSTVGNGSIGAWTRSRTSTAQLLVIALSAKPSAGLWRQIDREAWIRLAENPPKPDGSLSDYEWGLIQSRILTIALLAGHSSKDGLLRKRAWTATFGDLNRLLAAGVGEPDSWASLNSALTAGSSQNLSKGLRDGAVREMTRNNWSLDDIEKVIAQAGVAEADMRAQVAKARKEKNRSWIDLLNPFR